MPFTFNPFTGKFDVTLKKVTNLLSPNNNDVPTTLAVQNGLNTKVSTSDYNYQTITDTSSITLNANSKAVTDLYLDTARTATTVGYSNFVDGSIVKLKLKKQSASNLTYTVSTASIGIGNAVNNTIILTSPANSYFEIIVEARVVSGTPEYYVKVNPF